MPVHDNLRAYPATLGELFSNGKRYIVPPFQRDYAWDETQWEELWADVRALYEGEPEDSHFLGPIVLQPGETGGALKVIDLPEGATPRLPPTWPGLPLLIDSPGWQPILAAETVEVRVPFAEIGAVEAAGFDGVTAGLRVNANVHAPLLCVTDVFDVASGDLSLPGKVNQ